MEQKILTLLNDDPEKGMSLLMEQYMGLLWGACSLYLDNPEDIRECVQEAFLDFYEFRNRFSPEKGTVKAYLYVIAKRKAIRMSRRNVEAGTELLDENIADVQDMEEQLLNREILEQALSKLREQDSRMIRMKYYDGMTCAQIAHAMNLPLETVKKRQQRSLKKLRRILAAIAVLAVLTACAAVVVYKVRFSPTTGIQDAEEEMWYEMADDPVTMETEKGNVTIRSVIWKEQTFLAELDLENHELSDEEIEEEIVILNTVSGEKMHYSESSVRREDNEPIHIKREYKYVREPEEQYTFRIFDKEYIIDMKPINQYSDFKEIGNSQTHRGRTIVLQSRWEDQKLHADAYVYSDDLWKILSLEDDYINHENFSYLDPHWIKKNLPGGYAFYYEAETGAEKEYLLEIETLLLGSEGDTPTMEIPIPEDSVDVDIPFTVGADTYRVSRIWWSRGTYEYGIGDGGENIETCYGDELCIDVEPVDIEKNTRLWNIGASLGRMEPRYRYHYNQETDKLEEIGNEGAFIRIYDNEWNIYANGRYGEEIRMNIRESEELPEKLYLRIDHVYKSWDQPYTFRIKR